MKIFNPWKGVGEQPREIWVLSAAMLVNRIGTMILPFLVLYLTKELHFSDSRAGAMFAFYGAGTLIASPASGALSDAFGALRVMRVSLIGAGLVALVFPFVRGFVPVAAVTLALSLLTELFRPASMTIVSQFADPERRKPAFALTRLAINLGMSIGPAIGGLLAGISFVALFWVDGLTSLAAALVLFLALTLRAAPRATQPDPARKSGISFRALRDPRMAWLLIAQVPIGIVFFQFESAMPLFLVREMHFSATTYGLLFTINTVLIVALEIPLNLATAHWSHRRTLSIGALLVGLGFGVLAFAGGTWVVVLSVVAWTFGEMVLFPGLSAYVADISPDDRRGEFMGLYLMSFGLSFSIGPWLGTAVLDRFGATSLWVGCAAIGVFSSIAMAFLPGTAAPANMEKAAGA